MVLRWSRLLVRSVAAVLATAGILAALLVWRVAQGPISLGFLIPYVDEALALPDLAVKVLVADVVLAWSDRDESLRLRVLDARFRGADERVALQVPAIDIGLSGPSLLRGVIAPRYVIASGIDARLVRDASGGFQLGLPSPAEAAAETPAPAAPAAENPAQAILAGLFDLLSRPPSVNDPLSQLEVVSVIADRLLIEDWKINQRWVVPGAQIGFHRGNGRVFASVAGTLDWRERRVSFDIGAEYERASRSIAATLRFRNVEPSDFADVVPELAPLAYLAAPLDGTLRLRLDESGQQVELGFDLVAGAGSVRAPDILAGPLAITEARFRGQADAAGGQLLVDQADIVFADGFRAGFNGRLLRGAGERYSLDIKGQFFELGTDTLRTYWPPGMAKNARDWVVTHLSGGRVPAGRFEAKLTPAMLAGETRLPRDALKLDFAFEGVALDYLAPMTRLREGRGAATLNADSFDLTVESGRVGPLTLTEGRVRLTGLQDRDQLADITGTARGTSAELLGLIDQKPLGFPARMGVKPEAVAGNGTVKFRLRFPLLNTLRTDDVVVNADAELTDLALRGLMNRYDLSAGTLALKVDNKGLEASGRAALNGVPLALGWYQDFNARAAVTARYRLQGRLDEAQRKALGYPLAPYIDGPAQATLEIEERRGGETAIGGEFDLTATTIAVAEAYLGKAAGEAARGRIQVRTRAGQPVQFDLIEITGTSLSGSARAVLQPDGGWQADIASLQHGTDRIAGRIAFAANGDARIDLAGPRFDLRRFVADALAEDPEPGQAKPRLALRLRLDEARMDDDIELRNLALEAERAPRRLERVSLSAGFRDTGGVTLDIVPALNGRSLALKSDNAGTVLQFLGVTNMQGGTLRVDAAYDDTQTAPPLAGKLVLANVRAVRAPFLARLLGIGSLSGLAALLSGEGILFETGEVPFRQHDGVLALQRSRLQGPQLGITLEGNIYRRTDSIAITGTAVPAFVLNTILGRIPLLGDLLVGDGIIGVNFAVSGSRADPQFSVNPLSAIAPGFLRRIFQAPEAVPTDPSQPAPPDAPPGVDRISP